MDWSLSIARAATTHSNGTHVGCRYPWKVFCPVPRFAELGARDRGALRGGVRHTSAMQYYQHQHGNIWSECRQMRSTIMPVWRQALPEWYQSECHGIQTERSPVPSSTESMATAMRARLQVAALLARTQTHRFTTQPQQRRLKALPQLGMSQLSISTLS